MKIQSSLAIRAASFFVFLIIFTVLLLATKEKELPVKDENPLQVSSNLDDQEDQSSHNHILAIWINTQVTPQPEKVAAHLGDVKIHANEFFQYLRFISGYQSSKDLVQATYALHMEIALLAAQNYPPVFQQLVMQTLHELEPGSEAYQKQTAKFVDAQAELFAGFRYFANKATSMNVLEEDAIKQPLEFVVVNTKAQCLKNIIHLLPANFSLDDLQNRLENLSQKSRTQLIMQALEYKETQNNLQTKAERWNQYFNSLVHRANVDRPYQAIDSMYEKRRNNNGTMALMRIAPFTPVAKVGEHTITFQQVMTTQGRLSRDKNWQLSKQELVEPMIRAFILADEFDRLKLPTDALQNQLALQKELFLAIHQIKQEAGGKAFEKQQMDIFELKRRLQLDPERYHFLETLYKDISSLSGSHSLWIDSKYLKSLGWTIEIAPIDQLDSQKNILQ